MERVQHYASMEERKHLKPGVAEERNKPICSVDRPLQKKFCDLTPRRVMEEV